ncbi:MAG: lipid II flippase MurJ, partial [Ardenticatenaceae bacterium]
GTPIVRAFYERGEFSTESSIAVAYALSFFAFGIVGHALLEIVARLFYAQKDTLRPLYAALAMLLVTGLVSWLLLDALGIGAIALGDTMGVFVEVGLLLVWLRTRLPETRAGTMLRTTLKVVGAAAVMAFVLLLWRQLMAGANVYLVAGGGIVVGGVVYGIAALALGLEELRLVPRLVMRRPVA